MRFAVKASKRCKTYHHSSFCGSIFHFPSSALTTKLIDKQNIFSSSAIKNRAKARKVLDQIAPFIASYRPLFYKDFFWGGPVAIFPQNLQELVHNHIILVACSTGIFIFEGGGPLQLFSTKCQTWIHITYRSWYVSSNFDWFCSLFLHISFVILVACSTRISWRAFCSFSPQNAKHGYTQPIRLDACHPILIGFRIAGLHLWRRSLCCVSKSPSLSSWACVFSSKTKDDKVGAQIFCPW